MRSEFCVPCSTKPKTLRTFQGVFHISPPWSALVPWVVHGRMAH